MDTWSGTIMEHGTEPRIEFYYPPKEHVFSQHEGARVSMHALVNPTSALSWQHPKAVWLFWQVTLEIDDVEIARWGADWIADADGNLNMTVSLPFLAHNPGRHVAYITVMPGVVTTKACQDNSVSPGCPGYKAPSTQTSERLREVLPYDDALTEEHAETRAFAEGEQDEQDLQDTRAFAAGHGIIFYT